MSAYYNEHDPFAAAWLRELIKAGHIAHLVQDDLEASDYAFAAVGLPAASVGAPHIRQRLWFVADRDAARCRKGRPSEAGDGRNAPRVEFAGLYASGELADTMPAGRPERRTGAGCGQAAGCGGAGDVGHSQHPGLQEQRGKPGVSCGTEGTDAGQTLERASTPTFWDACDWLPCLDGKARPVEPGTFPLAYGVPARVGRLRGYGNAIVPQVGAEVIAAYMKTVYRSSAGLIYLLLFFGNSG